MRNPVYALILVVMVVVFSLVLWATMSSGEDIPVHELIIKNRTAYEMKIAVWNIDYGYKVWGKIPRYTDHTLRLKEGVYTMTWAVPGVARDRVIILTDDLEFILWPMGRKTVRLGRSYRLQAVQVAGLQHGFYNLMQSPQITLQ